MRMSTGTSIGKLYLIPTTLGMTEPLNVLPQSVKQVIDSTRHYIVENEKTARHFIKRISPQTPQPSLQLSVLNKFTDPSELPGFLEPCLKGESVGIISEAGCPGIADPGADVVAIAHQKGIQVVPLVGPSSILLALMGSGFNGQNFAFHGYLPIDREERKAQIKKLEKQSRDLDQSQLFIETPYRNDKLLSDLCSWLQDTTRLCVAANLTLENELIRSQPVSRWKHFDGSLHKQPAIFILYAR